MKGKQPAGSAATPPAAESRTESRLETRAETLSLAAQCIRALLDRAAIPRHRHAGHIASLLQLSYHQAHRRASGTAPWSVEELQAVAAHHGETLVDLFGQQPSADYENGVLIAGPLRVNCRVWPGQLLAQHRPGDLIAIKGGTEWVVMVASDTPTPQACSVKRLIVEPAPDRPRRFAVLDDDAGVAQGLASGLMDQGYEAVAFTAAAQLETALQTDSFDGFVVDWVLGGEVGAAVGGGKVTGKTRAPASGTGTGTAMALLNKLRSVSPSSPIALLTGKVGTPDVDEREMADAIQRLNLLFMQKPVTAALAASQFNAWFASR